MHNQCFYTIWRPKANVDKATQKLITKAAEVINCG